MRAIIKFKHKGSFKNTEKFFGKASKADYTFLLNEYGRKGVEALASATPVDSGETAKAWNYEIVRQNGKVAIYWSNSNVNNGVNIAVILQYGHATRNGGYVLGRDYINPAIAPIFDGIAEEAWNEVTT